MQHLRTLLIAGLSAVTASRAAPAPDPETPVRGVAYLALDELAADLSSAAPRRVTRSGMTSSHPQALPRLGAQELTGPIERDQLVVIDRATDRLVFKVGSRELLFNGARHWLAFPLALDSDGRLQIAALDRQNLLHPLLRGWSAVERRTFRGVVIDAGHGGSDRGARGIAGTLEKDVTLDTARRLKKILEARGLRTAMTRSSDTTLELRDRAQMANRFDDHIFVSIHYNQGLVTSHGVETFALAPRHAPSTSSSGRPSLSDAESFPGHAFTLESFLLAQAVQNQVRRIHSDEGDRGVKRQRFVVLRDTAMPATLVELGFLSHRKDAALIAKGDYRQKAAMAVADGIFDFLRGMQGAPSGR